MKKSYKIVIQFILILYCLNLNSQTIFGSDCLHCNTEYSKNLRKELIKRAQKYSYKSGTDCNIKKIRVNFYFVQDNNGNNNFSPTGDGLGNSYNGRDFSNEVLTSMNGGFSWNNKLKIPPNNSIPVIPKNLQFILDGVYYIKNTRINFYADTQNTWRINPANYESPLTFTSADFDSFALNKDSCLHIFIQGRANIIRPIPGTSNPIQYHAVKHNGGVGFSAGDYLCTESYARYFALKNNLLTGDNWGNMIGSEAGLLGHEICHSLYLAHTVLFDGSNWCPTMKDDGFISTTCDDEIPNSETPSAWYMRDTLNGPMHPADRNGLKCDSFPQWWSNNVLDYHSENALSPLQIKVMHEFIDTIRPNWLIEKAQKTNKSYCSWIGTRIAHFGKKVTLNQNCSSPLKVLSNTDRRIYCTQGTDIYNGFEVMANGYFEINETCPK